MAADETESNGAPKGLARRQKRLRAALLTCPTVRAACRQAGISSQRYYAWLKADPAFAASVRQDLQRVGDEARQTLRAAAARAGETLVALLDHADGHQRRLAAASILSFLRQDDITELSERLARLEQRYGRGPLKHNDCTPWTPHEAPAAREWGGPKGRCAVF